MQETTIRSRLSAQFTLFLLLPQGFRCPDQLYTYISLYYCLSVLLYELLILIRVKKSSWQLTLTVVTEGSLARDVTVVMLVAIGKAVKDCFSLKITHAGDLNIQKKRKKTKIDSTYHMSCVMCHLSHETCHTSRIIEVTAWHVQNKNHFLSEACQKLTKINKRLTFENIHLGPPPACA